MKAHLWNAGKDECIDCGMDYATTKMYLGGCPGRPLQIQPVPYTNTALDGAFKKIQADIEKELGLGLTEPSRYTVPGITASPAPKKKCTCPWDGPTGVYAVGCKCGGV